MQESECQVCLRPVEPGQACNGCTFDSFHRRISGDRHEILDEIRLRRRMYSAALKAIQYAEPLDTWQLAERFRLTRNGVQDRMRSGGFEYSHNAEGWIPMAGRLEEQGLNVTTVQPSGRGRGRGRNKKESL